MKEIKSVKESYDDYKSRINSRSYQMTDVEKRNLFYAYILDKKKMNKVILLQSNSGYSAEGSVRSIYNFMRKQDKWKNYKFVWVVKNKGIYEQWKKNDDLTSKCKCVYAGTKVFFYYLATASVIVSDTRMPACFIRRDDQRYIRADDYFVNEIQGYKLKNGHLDETSLQEKDYLSATDILSFGELYTEKVLKECWLLDGVFQGTIHQGISPRLYDIATCNISETKKKLSYLGIDGKKRLLVCNFSCTSTFTKHCNNIIKISEELKSKDVQVAVKVPIKEFVFAKKVFADSNVILIKNYTNMTDILSVADYLIGEEGKYTFDFLASNGVIMFWDNQERDCIVEEELPGIIISSISDVQEVINGKFDRTKYLERKNRWCELLNIPSKESQLEDNRVELSLTSNKKNILIVTPLAANTDQLYSEWRNNIFDFIDNIDRSKYTITLLSTKPKDDIKKDWLEKNRGNNIRILFRSGANVQRKENYYKTKYLVNNFIYSKNIEKALLYINKEDMKREMYRCLGRISIDTCVYYGQIEMNLFMLVYSLDASKKVYFDFLKYDFISASNEDISSVRARNLVNVSNIFDKIIHPQNRAIKTIQEKNFMKDLHKHCVFSFLPNFDRVENLKSNVEVKYDNKSSLLCNGLIEKNGHILGVLLANYRKSDYHIALSLDSNLSIDQADIMNWFREKEKIEKNIQIYVFDSQKQCIGANIIPDSMKESFEICSYKLNEQVVSAFDEVVVSGGGIEDSEYYYLCCAMNMPFSIINEEKIPLLDKKEVRDVIWDKMDKVIFD